MNRRRPAPEVVAVALVLLSIGAFAAAAGLAHPRFMGVDDALYMGMGANVLAGRGPVDAFGGFAAVHSPAWPILIAAPGAWLGVDPSSAAHALVVLAGAGLVAIVAWFSARVLLLAAPVAAAFMLAFPFFLDLGVELGLDLPASFLSLAYVAIGLVAVRRGSLRWGVAAGATFALAFLVKEIALPFAPVPLFAGLIGRSSPIAILRATGASLLAGIAGTAWWFVVYAGQYGTVYRLGTPAWTLGPLLAVATVVGCAAILAGRLASGPDEVGDPARRRLAILGWVGTLGWSAVLAVFFARSTGGSFLSPAQVVRNLGTWAPSLAPVLATGLVGSCLAVGDRIWTARRYAGTKAGPASSGTAMEDGSPNGMAVDDLVVAIICGFPLIPLVISVGEGPRHYTAELGLLVALGAAGWVHLAWRLQRRSEWRTVAVAAVALGLAALLLFQRDALSAARRVGSRWPLVALLLAVVIAGFIVGRRLELGRRLDLGRHLGAGRRHLGAAARAISVAILVLLTGSGMVFATVHVDRAQGPANDPRAQAVETTAAWVRANMPAGSTVAFGRNLAFETALQLQRDYRTVLVRDDSSIRVDPAAPLGVKLAGQPLADDWFALRASPTDVSTFYGYRASSTAERLRSLGVTIWIQTEIMGTSNVSPIGDALLASSGVRTVASWTWPYGSGHQVTTVFAIDPAALSFPHRLYLTRDALARITAGLENAPARAAPAAAALIDRATLVPTGTSAADLFDRLRKLATP